MAKVLLVEDDNNLREIYQARLMAEGYDIVAAQNGEEALVSAKQNKPDLIISDVMMPRISGFEMLDILRNTDELKNTKVIMLTALGQAEDQARADNLGADKYLVKSQVTLEDIVNAAKELLGEVDGTFAPAAPAVAADVTDSVVPPVPEPVVATPPVVEAPAVPAVPATPAVADINDTVVPASVVPQPDTTVVVPPAPANPTPPAVIVAPLPPEPVTPPAVPSNDVAAPELAPVVQPAPAAPAAPVEVTPAAMPSPVSPVLTPSATVPEVVPSEPAAEASVSEAEPQSLEAEEAALKAQIEGFANQPSAAPPVATPNPEPASVSNDEALANAVEQLNNTSAPAAPLVTPTPQPTPVTAPEPTPQPSTLGDSANVAHKKVISPISNNLNVGPNLDELLAKEEAAQGQPPAAPIVNGAAGQAPVAPPPATPGQSFDPNSISL